MWFKMGKPIKAIKKDLINAFKQEIRKARSLTELLELCYRWPGCGHSCGISDVFLEVFEKHGITEDDYFRLLWRS
jgi:hypothetical protein